MSSTHISSSSMPSPKDGAVGAFDGPKMDIAAPTKQQQCLQQAVNENPATLCSNNGISPTSSTFSPSSSAPSPSSNRQHSSPNGSSLVSLSGRGPAAAAGLSMNGSANNNSSNNNLGSSDNNLCSNNNVNNTIFVGIGAESSGMISRRSDSASIASPSSSANLQIPSPNVNRLPTPCHVDPTTSSSTAAGEAAVDVTQAVGSAMIASSNKKMNTTPTAAVASANAAAATATTASSPNSSSARKRRSGSSRYSTLQPPRTFTAPIIPIDAPRHSKVKVDVIDTSAPVTKVIDDDHVRTRRCITQNLPPPMKRVGVETTPDVWAEDYRAALYAAHKAEVMEEAERAAASEQEKGSSTRRLSGVFKVALADTRQFLTEAKHSIKRVMVDGEVDADGNIIENDDANNNNKTVPAAPSSLQEKEKELAPLPEYDPEAFVAHDQKMVDHQVISHQRLMRYFPKALNRLSDEQLSRKKQRRALWVAAQREKHRVIVARNAEVYAQHRKLTTGAQLFTAAFHEEFGLTAVAASDANKKQSPNGGDSVRIDTSPSANANANANANDGTTAVVSDDPECQYAPSALMLASYSSSGTPTGLVSKYPCNFAAALEQEGKMAILSGHRNTHIHVVPKAVGEEAMLQASMHGGGKQIRVSPAVSRRPSSTPQPPSAVPSSSFSRSRAGSMNAVAAAPLVRGGSTVMKSNAAAAANANEQLSEEERQRNQLRSEHDALIRTGGTLGAISGVSHAAVVQLPFSESGTLLHHFDDDDDVANANAAGVPPGASPSAAAAMLKNDHKTVIRELKQKAAERKKARDPKEVRLLCAFEAQALCESKKSQQKQQQQCGGSPPSNNGVGASAEEPDNDQVDGHIFITSEELIFVGRRVLRPEEAKAEREREKKLRQQRQAEEEAAAKSRQNADDAEENVPVIDIRGSRAVVVSPSAGPLPLQLPQYEESRLRNGSQLSTRMMGISAATAAAVTAASIAGSTAAANAIAAKNAEKAEKAAAAAAAAAAAQAAIDAKNPKKAKAAAAAVAAKPPAKPAKPVWSDGSCGDTSCDFAALAAANRQRMAAEQERTSALQRVDQQRTSAAIVEHHQLKQQEPLIQQQQTPAQRRGGAAAPALGITSSFTNGAVFPQFLSFGSRRGSTANAHAVPPSAAAAAANSEAPPPHLGGSVRIIEPNGVEFPLGSRRGSFTVVSNNASANSSVSGGGGGDGSRLESSCNSLAMSNNSFAMTTNGSFVNNSFANLSCNTFMPENFTPEDEKDEEGEAALDLAKGGDATATGYNGAAPPYSAAAAAAAAGNADAMMADPSAASASSLTSGSSVLLADPSALAANAAAVAAFTSAVERRSDAAAANAYAPTPSAYANGSAVAVAVPPTASAQSVLPKGYGQRSHSSGSSVAERSVSASAKAGGVPPLATIAEQSQQQQQQQRAPSTAGSTAATPRSKDHHQQGAPCAASGGAVKTMTPSAPVPVVFCTSGSGSVNLGTTANSASFRGLRTFGVTSAASLSPPSPPKALPSSAAGAVPRSSSSNNATTNGNSNSNKTLEAHYTSIVIPLCAIYDVQYGASMRRSLGGGAASVSLVDVVDPASAPADGLQLLCCFEGDDDAIEAGESQQDGESGERDSKREKRETREGEDGEGGQRGGSKKKVEKAFSVYQFRRISHAVFSQIPTDQRVAMDGHGANSLQRLASFLHHAIRGEM